MNLLTRDAILGAPEASSIFEEVEVPEWGGIVRVRALSGLERDRYEESLTRRKGKRFEVNMTNARARLVAMTCIDEENQPLFKMSDVEALSSKSAAALDRVFEMAMRLAGLSSTDLEELTENFTSGPADDSSSD